MDERASTDRGSGPEFTYVLCKSNAAENDREQDSRSGDMNVLVDEERLPHGDIDADLGDIVTGVSETIRDRTTIFDSTG